ncbi:hypothetical protein TNCT_260171 [Trichonephila clavata]|uniref:Uncharacterized protein n=1 Tax=Trichonephila clavata TaxID=2740835 RepID=A0A8X6LE07_TRICU|nr:hypothetical protein TNCT_260171 [Trichonephila clavata]
MQKSLFSLQRVHDHVYSQHKNVFQSVKDTDVENIKRFKDCNVPPSTPAVDQLLPSLDDEEEWDMENGMHVDVFPSRISSKWRPIPSDSLEKLFNDSLPFISCLPEYKTKIYYIATETNQQTKDNMKHI